MKDDFKPLINSDAPIPENHKAWLFGVVGVILLSAVLLGSYLSSSIGPGLLGSRTDGTFDGSPGFEDSSGIDLGNIKFTSVPNKFVIPPPGALEFIVIGDTMNNTGVIKRWVPARMEEKDYWKTESYIKSSYFHEVTNAIIYLYGWENREEKQPIFKYPAFIVHLGDAVAWGNSQGDWYNFWDNMYRLLKGTRKWVNDLYPVMGNHETFKVPGGPPLKSGRELIDDINPGIYDVFRMNADNLGFYHFTRPRYSVYGIVLDTERGWTRQERQEIWFKNQLEAAKDYKHVFVFQHIPIFNSNMPPQEGPKVKADIDDPYWKIMQDYPNVKIVFSGHSHGYERIKRIGDSKIISITQGNGGDRSLNPWGQPAAFTDVIGYDYGYGRVSVWGDNVYYESFDLNNKLVDYFMW